MSTSNYPSIRTLALIWLILILLSIGTIFTGQIADSGPNSFSIGLAWMAGLLIVTFFKSTLILNYFLDLKAATPGWSHFFIILVLLLLVLIFGLYAAGHYLA